MILPVFCSHSSLGKSILTLDAPKENDGGSDSVFDLAQEAGLKKIWLLEDTCVGVFDALKQARKLDIQLIWGLRIKIFGDDAGCYHKMNFFAKNTKGVFNLFDIYTHAETEEGINDDYLRKLDYSNLFVSIPFYDSYIHKNLFEFGSFVPFIPPDTTYFIEDNDHPFDRLLRKQIEKLKVPTMKVKSIYYKNRDDFEAWQTYKIICGGRVGGKKQTLSVPNLEHCCSREFCFESWKEANEKKA